MNYKIVKPLTFYQASLLFDNNYANIYLHLVLLPLTLSQYALIL